MYSNVILVEKTIGPSNYRLNAQDFMNDLSLNPVTNSKTSSDFDGLVCDIYFKKKIIYRS